MKAFHFIFLIALIFERGHYAHAQNSNLIINGNFEHFDSSKYPLSDGGNTELCFYLPNIKNNETGQAFNIKYVDCVKWLPYFAESFKYSTSSDCCLPIGYKNCFNWFFESYFYGDTNYPRKGETFIIMKNNYDTLQNKYTRGKHFLYMPLSKPLIKGKTYQLDFDLKTGDFSNRNFFNIDTVDFYASRGFGFGFTEQKPTFIQNDITYETDLVPEISIPYYNEKNWKQNTRYFIADSNYKYIVFGYFNNAANTFVKSKTPYCHLNFKDEIYSLMQVDNLFLQQVNDTLLPQDTTLCIGNSITIPSIQNKKINWWVNGVLQATQAVNYTFKPLANTIIIATDSIISDTMDIIVAPYPIFSVSQTDTLCNEVTAHAALPNTNTYTWQPDGLQGISVQLKGNALRTIIATNTQGCKDTLTFTPILGTGVCGTYYIPTAFTPNDDALNETFGIIGTGIQAVEISIYNLWGQCIYQATGSSPSWNGTFQNNPCPQGIYFYKINLTYMSNDKPKKAYLNGTITLLK